LHTRTVALFGPTDPARNAPYRGGDTQPSEHTDIVLRASGVRTTHKRSSQPHPSMLAISVDQVFDAVSRCIGAAR
jgi:ADP-heptose:LPS heptosyltransferase